MFLDSMLSLLQETSLDVCVQVYITTSTTNEAPPPLKHEATNKGLEITRGRRPLWRDVLADAAASSDQKTLVLACGPVPLRTELAALCFAQQSRFVYFEEEFVV